MIKKQSSAEIELLKNEAEKVKLEKNDLILKLKKEQSDLETLKSTTKVKINSLVFDKNELIVIGRNLEEKAKTDQLKMDELKSKNKSLEAEINLERKNHQFLKKISKDQETNVNALTLKLNENMKILENEKSQKKSLESKLKKDTNNESLVLFKGIIKNGQQEGFCTQQTEYLFLEGNFQNDKFPRLSTHFFDSLQKKK